jgi:hypothetical protein
MDNEYTMTDEKWSEFARLMRQLALADKAGLMDNVPPIEECPRVKRVLDAIGKCTFKVD